MFDTLFVDEVAARLRGVVVLPRPENPHGCLPARGLAARDLQARSLAGMGCPFLVAPHETDIERDPESLRRRYDRPASRIGVLALNRNIDVGEVTVSFVLFPALHHVDWAKLGLRLGSNPRAVGTTTPKPTRLIRDLLKREGQDVIQTRGSTYENAANLAPTFLNTIVRRYEGTRLGRQELDAEMLNDHPGAMWSRDRLDELRVKEAPPLWGVVVAIDPAMTSGEDADETGIVVVGLGEDGHGYVLDDLSAQGLQLIEWTQRAIRAYRQQRADRIVGEVNQGGNLIENTLRMVDANVSYKGVHASRGKLIRAEPVSALYEQGKVHHVGSFPALEDQMCSFTADYERSKGNSPDRLDALVWALSELCVEGAGWWNVLEFYRREVARSNGTDPDAPRPVSTADDGLIIPGAAPAVAALVKIKAKAAWLPRRKRGARKSARRSRPSGPARASPSAAGRSKPPGPLPSR